MSALEEGLELHCRRAKEMRLSRLPDRMLGGERKFSHGDVKRLLISRTVAQAASPERPPQKARGFVEAWPSENEDLSEKRISLI